MRVSRRAALAGALLGACRWLSAPTATLAADITPNPGPKKRVLVPTFVTISAFDTAFGGPESGAAVATQLSDLLQQSGQFDVLERSDLDAMLKEQGLVAAHGNVKQAAQHDAELLGAQVVVHGFVTTYSNNANSSGFSIGFGNPAFDQSNGTIGTNTSRGVIGIEIKLVDTSTGKLIAASKFDDDFHIKSHDLSVTGALSASKTNSINPVLGQVTENVMKRAASFIIEQLSSVEWVGHVVDVNADDIFLNVGVQNGASVGDVFAVSRVSRRIVDDESGELLGVVEQPIGQIKIYDVRDKFSIAHPTSEVVVQKDDVVRHLRN
jgi:curli biogenesis system outer membrane secretion channel CsgG